MSHHHVRTRLILYARKTCAFVAFGIEHHVAGTVELQAKHAVVIGNRFYGILDRGLVPVVVVGHHAGMGHGLVALGHHETARHGVSDIGHAAGSLVTLGTGGHAQRKQGHSRAAKQILQRNNARGIFEQTIHYFASFSIFLLIGNPTSIIS